MLGAARSRRPPLPEIVLWSTAVQHPSESQTSECSDLLSRSRATCMIVAQRQPGKLIVNVDGALAPLHKNFSPISDWSGTTFHTKTIPQCQNLLDDLNLCKLSCKNLSPIPPKQILDNKIGKTIRTLWQKLLSDFPNPSHCLGWPVSHRNAIGVSEFDCLFAARSHTKIMKVTFDDLKLTAIFSKRRKIGAQ